MTDALTDRQRETRRATNARYNARRRAHYKSLHWCRNLGDASDLRKGMPA